MPESPAVAVPVANKIGPDIPSELASAVWSLIDPDAAAAALPDRTRMSPPFPWSWDSTRLPAWSVTHPPVPEVLSPTASDMFPPAPAVAAPVTSQMAPVSPQVDVPELRNMPPDTPTSPALAVRSVIDPELLADPTPEVIVTEPPLPL